MSVERAPYIDYNEITSYMENIDNGSEIPLFVVKTNNTVSLDDIDANHILKFISYNRFKQYFSIPNSSSDTYDNLPNSMKEMDSLVSEFFEENYMYSESDEYGLQVPYIYIIDVGNEPTIEYYLKALEVSETRRKSTVVVFTDAVDTGFMKSVDVKLKEETKKGLFRIGYFKMPDAGSYTFLKADVIKPTLTPENYTGVVEAFLSNGKFYTDNTKTTEIEPETDKIYLNIGSSNELAVYKYNNTLEPPSYESIRVTRTNNVLIYEDDPDYKFRIPSSVRIISGADEEGFDEYCATVGAISQEVKSSRVAIVDGKYFGKIIARICSTPYYIEPGYLPLMSIPVGEFKERISDERDALFSTGLIFGEDDYTLANITPRICTATSTAWGVEDHDLRSTDSLIHARRNVDYHIRNLMKIVAPQLKRNETSVTIRYVQNQIDLYLLTELERGTIMDYNVKVVESSYNPYKLLIKGKITPVNSTLAIEFENTIGSPYTIASNYV